MPLFLAALLGGLVQATSSIVGRVLIALSISFVTYSGVQATIDYILGLIQSNTTGAGPFVVAALGLLQFDVAVGIISGAIAARLLIAGLGSDTVKRMVTK